METQYVETGSKAAGGGLSLTTIVALILMVLKLCGQISIGWTPIVLIWLSPLILVLGIFAFAIVVMLIIGIVGSIFRF